MKKTMDRKTWLSTWKDRLSGQTSPDLGTILTKVLTEARQATSRLDPGGFLEREVVLPTGLNKIEFCQAILEMGLKDKDYDYYDGECDNTSFPRQLATRLAREACQPFPDDPKLLQSLGYSLIQLGDYPRALTCFHKIVNQAPDDGIALNNIAWCQMRLGRFHEALDACEKALKFFGNHSYVHHNFAAILAGLGRTQDAIRIARQAVTRLQPRCVQLYYFLGCMQEKSGDSQGAIETWKQYLALAEKEPGHHRAISRVQAKLARYGVAIRPSQGADLTGTLTRQLFQELTLTQLFCLLLHLKIVKQKPELLSPEEKKATGKGMVDLLNPYTPAVEELCRRSVQLIPEEKTILAKHYAFLSLGHLLLEELEGVDDWLRQSHSLDPDNQENKVLRYAYNVLLVMKGVADSKKEYRLLKEALACDPRPGHAHVLLARHYCFKSGLKISHGTNIFRNYFFHRNLKKIEKIQKLLEQEAASRTQLDSYEQALLNEARFGVSLWKGVALFLADRDIEAERILKDLWTKDPNFYEIPFWLVLINIKKGDLTTARTLFKKIPSDLIPQNLSSKLKIILYGARVPIISFDDDFFGPTAPRFTGTSSSPLCKRFVMALVAGLIHPKGVGGGLV